MATVTIFFKYVDLSFSIFHLQVIMYRVFVMILFNSASTFQSNFQTPDDKPKFCSQEVFDMRLCLNKSFSENV